MPQYYRLDARRMSVPEWWRIARTPWRFFVALIRQKLLRLPLLNQPALVRIEQLARIAPAALPAQVQAAFEERTAEFEALGFARQFFYRTQAVGPQGSYAAAFLHRDGRSLAMSIVVVHKITPRPPHWANAIASRLDDGRRLATTDVAKQFESPPGIEVHRLRRRPLAQLVAHHLERLAPLGDGVRTFTAADVEPYMVASIQRNFDFQVERGLYVPIPDAEVARMRAIWEDDADDGDGRDGSVSIRD
jgi:hypothetical protein